MFFYLTRDTADGLTIQLSYHYSDRQEVMSITEAKFLFWCFLQREVGGFWKVQLTQHNRTKDRMVI